MWVSFLYSEVIRVLLTSGETRVLKKGMEPLSPGIFCGELDMWVNGMNLLEELSVMFCLLDDKGVIYIPEQNPGWIGDSADGLGFELFQKQVDHLGTDKENP